VVGTSRFHLNVQGGFDRLAGSTDRFNLPRLNELAETVVAHVWLANQWVQSAAAWFGRR